MDKKYMQALRQEQDVQGMQGSITTTLRLEMEGKEYELGKMKALG